MKASIIIPVYNAQALIESAVRSITDTPPPFDFEILAVDDGSRDASLDVLRALAQKIPRLRVISVPNSGPAGARNHGLDAARGEWILFLDSDDAFEPGAIEKAVTLCEEQKVQILIFGYKLIQDKQEYPYSYPDTLLASPKEKDAHLATLYRANMLNQVWGKVFSRKLLEEDAIRFPHALWGEDRLFFFSAWQKAERIACSREPLYRYVQNEGSLITRFVAEKPDLCLTIHRRVSALAKESTPEDRKIFSYMYRKSLLSCLSSLFSPSCPLTGTEKRRFVKAVLSQDALNEARDVPEDAGRSFLILNRVLQTGNVTANLVAAWAVARTSRVLPNLFRKAKHAYNKGEKQT